MNDVRAAVLQWLNGLGITDPNSMPLEDYQKVRQIMSATERPGFGIFLSMMMFERQKAVAQLMNADLSNSAGAVSAAKLQGFVQCVDTMRELVLNIADPVGEGSDSQNVEVAGVRFEHGRSNEQQPVG